VEAVTVNTSCVRVSWRPPAERHRNGVVTGYRVRYASEWAAAAPSSGGQRQQQGSGSDPPRDAVTVMMTGLDRTCTIAGLSTWTVYRIWVSAFTRAGEGPHSDMIVVQTDEGGTFVRARKLRPKHTNNCFLAVDYIFRPQGRTVRSAPGYLLSVRWFVGYGCG